MPDAEISGEEIEDLPPDIRRLFDGNRSRYVLVIDPIDGTDSYLGRGDKYAHMCGVLDREAGEMACSLVYFPELGRLYSAVRGAGSFVEDGIFSAPRPLAPTAAPRTFGRVKRLKAGDYVAFRRAGFSLDDSENESAAWAGIRVAEGDLGAMVMRHFHGYDTAITSLIIEEIGGAALGEDGGRVRYDKAMARMPLVILSLSPDLAAELFEAQRNAPPDPD